MIVRVEFTNPKLQDFIMEGPSVDYQIHQGFLVVTTNPYTNTPEKRVTFPIREVHAIFETNSTNGKQKKKGFEDDRCRV